MSKAQGSGLQTRNIGQAEGIRIVLNIPSGEVLDLLDRRELFERRWGYGPVGPRSRLEMEVRLKAMWEDLSAEENWSAAAIWGRFEARLASNGLELGECEAGTVLGLISDKLPRRFISGFGLRGYVVLQAVTMGAKATRLAKKKRSISERLFWHGLAAEATEALADWCSRMAAKEMGWEKRQRISPGFPAWPELSEQGKLFRILRPSRIGLRLSRSWQMVPEYSTSAMVCAV